MTQVVSTMADIQQASSKIADMNNVSSSGFAGAIIGALFLRRFVSQAKCWAVEADPPFPIV